MTIAPRQEPVTGDACLVNDCLDVPRIKTITPDTTASQG
jgi:hypothetical protein